MNNEQCEKNIYESPEVTAYETRVQSVICQSSSRTGKPQDYEFEDWEL